MDIENQVSTVPVGGRGIVRARAPWLELGARATAAVCALSELRDCATEIASQACAFGALASCVFVPGDERTLRLQGVYELPSLLQESLRTLPLDEDSLAAEAWRRRELSFRRSNPQTTALDLRALQMIAKDASFAAVPLVAGSEGCGVLLLALALRSDSAYEGLAALVRLAPTFAAALRSARAYSAERRHRVQAELVLELQQTVVGGEGVVGVLDRIGECARKLTRARGCAVGLFDRESDGAFSTWVCGGSSPEAATALHRPEHPEPLPGVVHSALGADCPLGLKASKLAGEDLLAVTLSWADRPMANLYVLSPEGGGLFSDEDAEGLTLMARQASVALEHARREEALVEANATLVDELSELGRTAARLQSNEERFRSLVEGTEDAMFRIRLSPPAFEYVSPSILRLMGVAPEEAYQDPAAVKERIHPADRPLLRALFRSPEAFRGPLQLRVRQPGGEDGCLEMRVVPEYDDDGVPVALVGVARDVTERMLAENEREALLANVASERSWLRAVMEGSPVGIILHRDGLMHANRRVEELLGLRIGPSLPLTRILDRMRHLDGSPITEEQMLSTRALRGERTSAQEVRVVHPDGTAVPVLVCACPIRSASGEVLGAATIVDDLSSVKDLERLREEWTAVIAHDLRQPVHSILLSSGFIERAVAGTTAERHARHIVTSAQLLERMIVDLLDASRVEANQLSIEPERVDVLSLVMAVLDRRAAADGRPVVLDADSNLPAVEVDPARFEQVLGNLVSNAIKYGSPGTPVRVELRRRGELVEAGVINQGRGIPQEDLPNLFKRFQRSNSVRAARISGVGLGLYIARGLVEAHGGTIWAESTPGATTAFRFTVPLAPARCSGGEV